MTYHAGVPVITAAARRTWISRLCDRASVRDPRGILAEFSFVLDPAVQMSVWDASAESRYMVLPRRPAGTEDLGEHARAALVTSNGLIGVAPV
jgi:nitrile hydratase